MQPTFNEEYIKNFVHLHLGSEQYRTYNVEVAKKIGIEEAIILNELIDQHKFYIREKKLIEIDGESGYWFYCDYVRFEERTAIKEKALSRVLKCLKREGLITYISKGVPPKRHFQINYDVVFNFLNNLYKIPKRELRSAKMGTTSNDPNKDTKRTTTSQPPPTPKPPDAKEPQSEVVVPSLFSTLKISLSKKLSLQSKYTEAQIETAVERVLAWEGRRCDEAAIEYALQNADSWKEIISKEQLIEKNRRFCQEIEHLDGKRAGGLDWIVSRSGVGAGVGTAYKFFSVEEKGFIESVKKYLEQAGIAIAAPKEDL